MISNATDEQIEDLAKKCVTTAFEKFDTNNDGVIDIHNEGETMIN